MALGAFTVPGDGSLDFGAIVQRFADYGYEGWFVVEAEQDPRKNPPLRMAQVGHKELMRVMTAAGYTVETQGFPKHEPAAFAQAAGARRRGPHVTPAERRLDLCRLRSVSELRAGETASAAATATARPASCSSPARATSTAGGKDFGEHRRAHVARSKAPPAAVYVPAGSRLARSTATSAVELAVCTAPGRPDREPARSSRRHVSRG